MRYEVITKPVYMWHRGTRIAFLENGEAGLAFGSGMAAISSIILSLCKSGENVVASNTLYGGTHQFFMETLPRYSIEVSYNFV